MSPGQGQFRQAKAHPRGMGLYRLLEVGRQGFLIRLVVLEPAFSGFGEGLNTGYLEEVCEPNNHFCTRTGISNRVVVVGEVNAKVAGNGGQSVVWEVEGSLCPRERATHLDTGVVNS